MSSLLRTIAQQIIHGNPEAVKVIRTTPQLKACDIADETITRDVAQRALRLDQNALVELIVSLDGTHAHELSTLDWLIDPTSSQPGLDLMRKFAESVIVCETELLVQQGAQVRRLPIRD